MKYISYKNYPKLLKEFNQKKNNNISLENYSYGSSKDIWWICKKGHEWKSRINRRVKGGSNCPYCEGRLADKKNNIKILYPKLMKEWNVRNSILPESLRPGSSKKVWWICKKGHEWKAIVSSRVKGKKCPYCKNRKVDKKNNFKYEFPEIAKEWHPTKNGSLKPEHYFKSSLKRFWWKCSNGHEWISNINARVYKKTQCPKCSFQSSKPEYRILSELKYLFPKTISRYRLDNIEIDIFLKEFNIGIEFDGSYWHLKKESNDKNKNIKLKKIGINLIRVRGEPLNKISDLDVIVKSENLIKNDLNNLIKSIQKLIPNKQNNKLNNYIKKKTFINEKLYKKFLSYFPSPLPEHSLLYTHKELSKEWHYKKNHPLKPENFTFGSLQSVWWQCKKKHIWETRITARSRGSGCPYCSGLKVSKENNLKVVYPKIAKEWHYKKNKKLRPEDFTKASSKKVWWKCSKGHEWIVSITTRAKGTGCPYCSGHKREKNNNFASLYPRLEKEWNYSKNINLNPYDLSKSSITNVWWICKKKHEWKTRINARTLQGSNCPYCAGSKPTKDNNFKVLYPNLMKEWHYKKNKNINPELLMKGTSQKVWWICKKNHEWFTSLNTRTTQGSNCPRCEDLSRKK